MNLLLLLLLLLLLFFISNVYSIKAQRGATLVHREVYKRTHKS
jgi:uncharacterized protein (DUF58 family)